MDRRDPRIISTVKTVAFVAAYLVAAVLLGVLVRFLPASYMDVFNPVVPVLMLIALAICFRVFWDREPVATMGLESTPTWGYDLVSGFAVGLVLISLVFVIPLLTGGLTFKSHFTGGMFNVAFFAIMAFFFIGMLFQVFAEEIVFRGYLFVTVKSGWGMMTAVAVTSVLFGVGHIFNPGFSWAIALNLVLAGILMALGVVVTGNIWWPLGFHLAWNFFEGYIYGFPVSGLTASPISMFFTKITAPSWLMGGSFGPEGGLAGTLAFTAGIIWLLYLNKKKEKNARTA
jgi:hypothetical protein